MKKILFPLLQSNKSGNIVFFGSDVENIIIQLPSGSENASVAFYDYTGRLALTQTISQINNSINVQNLSSGVYILKVLADDKVGSQKFIKK